MTQQLYKNWTAICMVADPILKVAVSAAEDPETLAGFQAAFPQLFCVEEQRPQKMPFSVLLARWETDGETSERAHNRTPYTFGHVMELLHHYGIPVLRFSDDPSKREWCDGGLFKELAAIGATYFFDDETRPTVSYMGQEYFIVERYEDTGYITPVACFDLDS